MLGAGCVPEPPPHADTPADRLLRERLTEVKEDYRQLRLAQALDRARALPLAGATHDELRAEAYQYLALLHFDRSLYRDSIGHYTELAGDLVDAESPPHLRARQQLCRALQRYYSWTWREMDLAAALGLRILEEADLRHDELYGSLQVARGVARKMYAYSSLDTGREQALLREAGGLLQQAVRTLRRLQSPRLSLGYEELAILYSRLPDSRDRVRPLVDSIRLHAAPASAPHASPDRVLGYYHRQLGQADSVRHYYRQLLARDSIFRYDYISEAQFVLREYLGRTGQWEEALALNSRVLLEADCCPQDSTTTVQADAAATCTRGPACIYDLVEQAYIYHQRYRSRGTAADLDVAYTLAQAAVDHYDDALRQLTEESAYHRLISLGDRLVSVALDITYATLQRDPQPAYRDALLRTAEFGKSYLLNKELAQRSMARREEAHPLRDSLVATNRELTLLKQAYTQQSELPTAQLLQVENLIRQRDRLQQRLQPAFENFARQQQPTGYLSVRGVQEELTAEQALLEFTETSSELLVLYIDRDTAVVYPVDTAVLALAPGIERALVELNPTTAALTAAADRLGDALLGPVAALLAGRQDLLLIPPVQLSRFPFAILSVPATDTFLTDTLRPYLVEQHSIRYLDSWQTERRNMQRRTALGQGVPTLPRIGVWTHPELAGYLGPLGEWLVEQGSSRSIHYVGTACSSEQLLDQGDRYDWLHLSVHARGNTVELNDNYLYLNARDSLNGLHIGSRRLTASLVVLAACSTARGVSSRREGTYSIRRSFHRAGVPDVVASLYDIPAAATAGVLEEFYRGLWRGLPPERALAGAQRACLTGGLSQRWKTRPGFWAGLVMG
ncbi:hypothetical protein LEM8419_03191 [Neolewinella maritima]|uniref:CHAT domain-containing protein n=2 Tax=Neolewinella maritima TaxID=1383882 RepID=A0ABM9B4L1_9BACT|nr:hypothetical protein LEM8419_03191 [Neolewinella maritima]